MQELTSSRAKAAAGRMLLQQRWATSWLPVAVAAADCFHGFTLTLDLEELTLDLEELLHAWILTCDIITRILILSKAYCPRFSP